LQLLKCILQNVYFSSQPSGVATGTKYTPYKTIFFISTGTSLAYRRGTYEGIRITQNGVANPCNTLFQPVHSQASSQSELKRQMTLSRSAKVVPATICSNIYINCWLRLWLARAGMILFCFPAWQQPASAQVNLILSWTYASTTEAGFGIQRATSPNGPWTKIGTVAAPATSYLDTYLQYSTTYYYQIWTYNATGNSPLSNISSFTTPAAHDTTKPGVSIVSPKVNEKWSNSVFTVSGKASDNVAVANVFYSLNGSGWTSASTGNGWTNWVVNMTLIPGTNVVMAYAVDTSGNVSATNKISFIHVLTAPLTVLIDGGGTVSPNSNGDWLQIGENYSMTARAKAGYVFTYWTGSLTTNGATLKFTMASNLTFTANFMSKSQLSVQISPPEIGNLTVNQGMATLSFESQTGLFYTLESKDTYADANWTVLPVSIIGTGEGISLTDSNAPPASRFYRIRARE
jgi:uncharacterized repeat protein (TIGR02543 family)